MALMASSGWAFSSPDNGGDQGSPAMKKFQVHVLSVVHRVDTYEVTAANRYEAEIYYAQKGVLAQEGEPETVSSHVESTVELE